MERSVTAGSQAPNNKALQGRDSLMPVDNLVPAGLLRVGGNSPVVPLRSTTGYA
ncbi:MAG: hypothetical protein LBL39_08120 [Planctomycetaceae bacterium]|nr:hypothetical protein [Planctomycetaceae bacterium]